MKIPLSAYMNLFLCYKCFI